MELVCDNRKARQLLGWEPRVTLDDGLRRVIAFVREHEELYNPETYNL